MIFWYFFVTLLTKEFDFAAGVRADEKLNLASRYSLSIVFSALDKFSEPLWSLTEIFEWETEKKVITKLVWKTFWEKVVCILCFFFLRLFSSLRKSTILLSVLPEGTIKDRYTTDSPFPGASQHESVLVVNLSVLTSVRLSKSILSVSDATGAHIFNSGWLLLLMWTVESSSRVDETFFSIEEPLTLFTLSKK